MRITFVTRKFGNVERNSHCDVLHNTPIRVARLFLDCNGDFAIKAYGQQPHLRNGDGHGRQADCPRQQQQGALRRDGRLGTVQQFSAKRRLKGTKFVVTENLTRRRNDLLKKVRSLSRHCQLCVDDRRADRVSARKRTQSDGFTRARYRHAVYWAI